MLFSELEVVSIVARSSLELKKSLFEVSEVDLMVMGITQVVLPFENALYFGFCFLVKTLGGNDLEVRPWLIFIFL